PKRHDSDPPRHANSDLLRARCPFLESSFVLEATMHHEGGNDVKYMLLIHQGDTPVPGSEEWEALSEDEQKAVAADYQSVNQTEGVTPGVWMESPETATTVRVENG